MFCDRFFETKQGSNTGIEATNTVPTTILESIYRSDCKINSASNIFICKAYKYIAATAKITRIVCRAVDKVTRGFYVSRFAEIYRARLAYGIATRLLQKAAATSIAKLETLNWRLLLISLKLQGSAIDSRCIESGGISGGVAERQE